MKKNSIINFENKLAKKVYTQPNLKILASVANMTKQNDLVKANDGTKTKGSS